MIVIVIDDSDSYDDDYDLEDKDVVVMMMDDRYHINSHNLSPKCTKQRPHKQLSLSSSSSSSSSVSHQQSHSIT
jgi:hypothetical protein